MTIVESFKVSCPCRNGLEEQQQRLYNSQGRACRPPSKAVTSQMREPRLSERLISRQRAGRLNPALPCSQAPKSGPSVSRGWSWGPRVRAGEREKGDSENLLLGGMTPEPAHVDESGAEEKQAGDQQ